MTIKVGRFYNPERGGHKVELLIAHSTATIMDRNGIRNVRIHETWQDIGTLMAPVTNVVREQPKSLAEKLVEARQADTWEQVDRAIVGTGRRA